MKVRHTTRCAGGCGTFLVPGNLAERRHRTLWCAACHARHLLGCESCQEHETVRAPSPREPVLF